MDVSKEKELRIVLKNYDALKEQKNALEKENEELKKQLVQQKSLYKNMLDRFTDKGSANWEFKYNSLKDSYKKLGDKYSRAVHEFKNTKRILDSFRGIICDSHNKLDDLCERIGVDFHITEIPNQMVEEVPLVKNDSQQQKFVKYIRTMVEIYNDTGKLNGISKMASEFNVTAITKVQFFKYGLHEKDLTDEKILKVYEEIKKR